MRSPELTAGIRRVKGAKELGVRVGNWLSTDEAKAPLASDIGNAPRHAHSRLLPTEYFAIRHLRFIAWPAAITRKLEYSVENARAAEVPPTKGFRYSQMVTRKLIHTFADYSCLFAQRLPMIVAHDMNIPVG